MSELQLSEGVSSDRNLVFADFKSSCYATARQAGYKVISLHEPGQTPNYFFASLISGEQPVAVLCNAAYPLVAFASGTNEPVWEPDYIDHPALAIGFAVQGYRCLQVDELKTRAVACDLNALRESEIKDINYWKPQTLAEIIFNHWD